LRRARIRLGRDVPGADMAGLSLTFKAGALILALVALPSPALAQGKEQSAQPELPKSACAEGAVCPSTDKKALSYRAPNGIGELPLL
jgi:hypothetical protein